MLNSRRKQLTLQTKYQSNYKVTSDCRIKEILVQEGDNITGDQTLITLEPIA